jgi:hypothetical protein
MPISFAESARLTCPACQAEVTADVWALVDAAERPDLAEALRAGTLDLVTCPSCGHQWPAGAPLLFHDPASRRVYFAVPPDAEEHRWREAAQSLLYALVESLPEDDRRPYLGDVQVEHEVAGVRRSVLRRDRARGRAPAPAPAAPVREPADSGAPAPAAPAEPSALLAAVHELLAADTEAEFARVLAQRPELLTEPGDAALRQLADLAYAQGDRDVSEALRELRAALARRRTGEPDPELAGVAAPPPAVAELADTALLAVSPVLPDTAYQALLHVASPGELAAAARDYPALLEPAADAELLARVEAALGEGNERLAQTIEVRREALADLRASASGEASLLSGVRALTQAAGDEAIAQVLTDYPMLLTDAAQEALAQLAAGAQSRGDQRLASEVAASRAMLRTIRAGLEEH